MKVVMVCPFGLRPHGTVSRRALPLGKALAARGHTVDLVLPPWSCPEDSGRAWQEDGVSIRNIVLPSSIPVWRDVLIVLRLLRRALAGRPQVLHFFKPKGYSGLVAVLLWSLVRVPFLAARVVLDSDDWEGPGGWNDAANYSWWEKRLFAWQERWGMTHCHALTLASRTLRDLALGMGIEPRVLYHLPNGAVLADGPPDVEAGDRVRAEFSLGRGPVVLLYTRFFEWEPRRVVSVIDRVVAECPSARLLVVGAGLFGEEERFLALAEESGLSDHLCYVGWREGSVLAGCFAAADLAIFPQDDTLLNRARCPAKLADLMAAGLPVVADDVGQVGDYIDHMSSGYLVSPGDVEAFVRGVMQLLEDTRLRVRLGQQARQRMEQHFGWDKLATVVEEAYAG
jgi:glycosyltransferase involved in cell wall biosynthesis